MVFYLILDSQIVSSFILLKLFRLESYLLVVLVVVCCECLIVLGFALYTIFLIHWIITKNYSSGRADSTSGEMIMSLQVLLFYCDQLSYI